MQSPGVEHAWHHQGVARKSVWPKYGQQTEVGSSRGWGEQGLRGQGKEFTFLF